MRGWQQLRLKIFDDQINGCLSYLIGDEVSGKAVLIDPSERIGVEKYLLSAQDLQLHIVYVIDTHIHADHVSCAKQIAGITDARIVMSRLSPLKTDFVPSEDLREIDFGNLRFELVNTPGHTAESISVIIYDLMRSSDPYAVLTGDLLFAGDVGRSDLALLPEEERKMSADSYRSIKHILTLPDYVLIMPAHYGASKCGGIYMSGSPLTTVGYERKNNRFLESGNEIDYWNLQYRFRKILPESAMVIREKNITGGSD